MSAFWEGHADLRDQDPAEVRRRMTAELVERARRDPGAAFEPDALDVLAALRTAEPAEYQRLRARLKEAGARVGDLDRAVERARRANGAGDTDRGQGRPLELPQPEPWPEPVDGAKLLDGIAGAFRRYLALTDHADTTLALFAVHCHAFDAGQVTPRLAFISPEKRCGKTTGLTILGRLVPRPLPAANVTAAAVFRTIEKARPTLLIDEADTFIGNSDELRGVLNSGHSRATAYVVRTVGDDHEPRLFSTWAPVAIACIGSLPGTLQDRSVVISMRRRAATERVERLRLDRLDHLNVLARWAARWAADHTAALAQAEPEVPPELHDRAADNWRPLFAIADLAGGEWPKRARDAAETLAGNGGAVENSVRVQLLSDLRGLFEANEGASLWSSEICDLLVKMEDRRWPEWKAGKPITPRQLAKLLEPFGIRPKDVWKGSKAAGRNLKGYERPQFEDAFSRYLPSHPARPLDPAASGVFNASEGARPNQGLADVNRLTASVSAGSSGLAGQSPPPGAEGSSCVYCGAPEKRGMPLEAYGDPSKGVALMHPHCRANWLRERRADAMERTAIVERDGAGQW